MGSLLSIPLPHNLMLHGTGQPSRDGGAAPSGLYIISCIYIYIYTYIHTYIHTYNKCVYIYIYIYIYIIIYIYIYRDGCAGPSYC